ncbi:MAG: EscU/YscU/HrcU family type III secretion system export apparatus switch protein [bacterium]
MEEERRYPRIAAVALEYDPEVADAPMVTAKGKGYIAERIIEIAEEHDIPIREDPDLVEVLSKVDVGAQIPPELYQVVAEILAFVYRMNERAE